MKKDDHAMDELRYYLMHQPDAYREERPVQNVMLEHKKKLAMRLKKMRR